VNPSSFRLGVAPPSAPLLGDRAFLSLWLAHGTAQVAYNAVLFTLLVVILKVTGSSTQTSLLLLLFVLPTVLVGPLAGVLLDRWEKAQVLWAVNAIRALACGALIVVHGYLWTVYLLALPLAVGTLLFNAAVMALIGTLVPKERLVSANSLYNFTLMGAQFVGLVILAPLVLRLGGDKGDEAMFMMASAMFALVALAALPLRERGGGEKETSWVGLRRELSQALQLLVQDRATILALVQLTIGNTLVLLFVTLMPRYTKDILNVSPANAAFIFAPTGIGALIGLRLLPWAARNFGKEKLVPMGLLGIAFSLLMLALVQPIAYFMERAPRPLNPQDLLGLSLLQLLTMVFAGPLGLCYAFLNAPAQTVLHERAPQNMRGRIFTAQGIISQSVSLLPVILIGAITDVLDAFTGLPGIVLTLLIIALGLGLAALINFWLLQRWGLAEAKA